MMPVSKPVVVSGVQSSGELHLGNYLGALKNWLEIQNSGDYNCYFFIADYHSLSEYYDPEKKREQVFDIAATYLALGFDPDKSIIFVQSQVPACTELAWIFNTLTPIAELERMTQFKDKSLRQVKNINMGLFDYPVLQAADILLYHGTAVPVGEDQIQHIELTRDIAKWFNNKYQTNYFAEVKPLLTPAARVMSLADPSVKMSKSLGGKYYIGIDESPEIITKKFKKAVTTPEGIENLKMIYDAFSSDMKAEFDEDKMADTKEVIASGIAEHFADFREKKAELKKNRDYVNEILSQGREKAAAVSAKTISEVREIIGVK